MIGDCDIEEMTRTLRVFVGADCVTEIRILNAITADYGRPHVLSGYVDGEHFEQAAQAAANIVSASGVYFVPNRVNPDLLARAENRLKASTERGATTSDGDIVERRYLLLDLDPVRPSGISSTDSEHDAALQRARDVAAALAAEGWPKPALADSGNGGHVVYRIDLPVKDDGLVERCLHALAGRFDDAQVKVDTTVHNPARIWKLYGTMACKGDNTPDRPHRLAKLLDVPESFSVVPRELLEKLAAACPQQQPVVARAHAGGRSFELDSWIEENDLRGRFGLGAWEVWHAQDGGEGRRCVFATCPWDPAHTGGSAFLLQFADGAIAAGCQHASCEGHDWRALRDLLEPGWQDAHGGAAHPKAADVLLGLVRDSGATLFHTPGADGEGFVSIEDDGHVENFPLDGHRCQRWLRRMYFAHAGAVPNRQAVDDALATLEGQAAFDGAEYEVAVRVAGRDGRVYLDLGDASWQAVEIDADGWRVVSPEVKFIRPRGLLPLPAPVRGGRLDELRELLNVGCDQNWVLLSTYLAATFIPGRSLPILLVQGEQGSCKSTACRMVRDVVDPNTAGLRAEPREVRDLVIAAKNSWIQSYDNLSALPPWLSDALCRLSTGGGFATRALYQNDDEILINVLRPVIINGIGDLAVRSDLLDRTVRWTLPAMPDDQRRAERALTAEFERHRPTILGALLDGVSAALRNEPTACLPSLPRMADFALFGVAAEQALGLPQGAFLAAYAENRRELHDVALEASPFVPALLDFAERWRQWSGTSHQLLSDIERDCAAEPHTVRQRGWPQNPRQVTAILRRLAPNLRSAGLDVEFGRHRRAGLAIELRWVDQIPQVTANPPHSSPPAVTNDSTVTSSPLPDPCAVAAQTATGTNDPSVEEQHVPQREATTPPTERTNNLPLASGAAVRGPMPRQRAATARQMQMPAGLCQQAQHAED